MDGQAVVGEDASREAKGSKEHIQQLKVNLNYLFLFLMLKILFPRVVTINILNCVWRLSTKLDYSFQGWVVEFLTEFSFRILKQDELARLRRQNNSAIPTVRLSELNDDLSTDLNSFEGSFLQFGRAVLSPIALLHKVNIVTMHHIIQPLFNSYTQFFCCDVPPLFLG